MMYQKSDLLYNYAFWDEVNSEEKPGWYLAKVTSLSGRGEVTVLYRSGGSTKKSSYQILNGCLPGGMENDFCHL